MNEILKAYVSVSFTASLLALLLFILRPLYQQRFSRCWQYYIWLVVLVRLVIPWNPQQGIIGRMLQTQQVESRLAAWVEWRETKGQAEKSQAVVEQAGAIQIQNSQTEIQQRGSMQGETDSGEWLQVKSVIYKMMQSMMSNIGIIWLSIAGILFIRKVTIYQSFVKYLKAGCVAVDDMQRLETLGKIVECKRIRRMIGLYRNRLTASPLLLGFFQPNIILTQTPLSDTDFYFTVLHELTHYKRRDMLYKWLVQLVLCLHWFNPLVYRMEREISRLCELSCDEAVMKGMDRKGRREYGDTLLRAMRAGGTSHPASAVMNLNESKELLKERLGGVMNDRKITRFARMLSMLCAVLLAGSAVAMGAYVQPAAAEKQTDTVLSDCKMIQEEGEFYIICEGADEKDRPTGSITEGCIGITLVWQDEYTSIGPFESADTLVRDVTEQITYMRERDAITQTEARLLLEAAEKIQEEALAVKLNRTSVSLNAGQSVTLKLTGTKRQAVWSSEQKNIAVVSQNGKVTARKVGNTRITAKLGGRTFRCKVKVANAANSNNQVKKESVAESRQEWGITKKNGAYFYQCRRIRIFMDLRSDQSFVKFNYDTKGSIDIKLKRAKDLSVIGVEYLTAAEAKEILQDMGDADTEVEALRPELSITRLSKTELPEKLLKAVRACKDRTWYVMAHDGYQYIYYNDLPDDYAFEPEISAQRAKIKIVDMKSSSRHYVLLAVKKNVALTIIYQGREAEYQSVMI